MATRVRKKVRFENDRNDVLFFRDIVCDGRRIFVDAGSTNRVNGVQQRFEKSGQCLATPDLAEAAFQALIKAQEKRWSRQLPSDTVVEIGDESLATATTNAALEAQLAAGEAGAAGVFADWLQREGDPRGELAALVMAGANVDAWLATHGARLFGDLDVKLHSEIQGLVWKDGFLDGVSLRRASMDSTTQLAALTREVLALPVAQFLTSLRFGLASFESDNDWTETLRAVTASTQAPRIVALRFDDYNSEDCELSWTPFGDFGTAWAGLPSLEHLLIRAGGDGQLGEIDAPSLKSFARETGGLATAEVDTILRARWPRLERLDLWLGNNNYGGTVSVAQVEQLLANAPPTLTHLGLCNAEIAPDLIVPLEQSKLLPRLSSLDLKMGILNDSDVDTLLRHAPAFAHLAHFDLSENLFGERTAELAVAFPKAHLANQRYEADQDPEDRYTAVGE